MSRLPDPGYLEHRDPKGIGPVGCFAALLAFGVGIYVSGWIGFYLGVAIALAYLAWALEKQSK